MSQTLRHALIVALGLAALPLAQGCLQTTVKTTDRRYLTAEEAAEAEQRRKDAAAERGEVEKPKELPRTVEQEIDRMRGLVEKEPLNPQWHFELGRLYEEQGKFELAEFRYRRGGDLIQFRNAYTGPSASLGRVLAKQGKTVGALEALRTAVAVKPHDIEGYYFNPDYRDSYFLIGAIEYGRKNVGDSERAFRLFLKYGGERNKVIDFFPDLIAE